MALTSDEVIRILKEAVLGLPPSLTGEAALALRAKLDVDVQAAREQGLVIDFPVEIPDPDLEPRREFLPR